MSTFSGGYGPEEEDGAGWGGLVASKAEQRAEARQAALEKDAARYRWLCGNNFDREGATQVHTWLHTWEPHSQTGEPTEWTQRIRGGALDAVIDAAMAAEQAFGAA